MNFFVLFLILCLPWQCGQTSELKLLSSPEEPEPFSFISSSYPWICAPPLWGKMRGDNLSHSLQLSAIDAKTEIPIDEYFVSLNGESFPSKSPIALPEGSKDFLLNVSAKGYLPRTLYVEGTDVPMSVRVPLLPEMLLVKGDFYDIRTGPFRGPVSLQIQHKGVGKSIPIAITNGHAVFIWPGKTLPATFSFAEAFETNSAIKEGMNASLPDASSLDALSPGVSSLDASSPDVSSLDVSSPDVSSLDASSPDVSSLDVSSPDVSSLDASSPDVSSLDVSSPGVSSLDVSSPDASSLDVSSPDVSSLDVSSPGVSSLDVPFISRMNGFRYLCGTLIPVVSLRPVVLDRDRNYQAVTFYERLGNDLAYKFEMQEKKPAAENLLSDQELLLEIFKRTQDDKSRRKLQGFIFFRIIDLARNRNDSAVEKWINFLKNNRDFESPLLEKWLWPTPQSAPPLEWPAAPRYNQWPLPADGYFDHGLALSAYMEWIYYTLGSGLWGELDGAITRLRQFCLSYDCRSFPLSRLLSKVETYTEALSRPLNLDEDLQEQGTGWNKYLHKAPWGPRIGYGVSSFKNALWFYGGKSFDGSVHADVWVSTDGEHWLPALSSAPWSPRFDHAGFVYDGSLWVIGGISTDGRVLSDIWRSEDGILWEEVEAHDIPWRGFPVTSVHVFNEKMWIWIEKRAPFFSTFGWSSRDGLRWDPVSAFPPQWQPGTRNSSLVFNEKLWFVNGSNAYWNLTAHSLWASSNGTLWRNRSPIFLEEDASMPVKIGVCGTRMCLITSSEDEEAGLGLWSSENGYAWDQLDPIPGTHIPMRGYELRSFHHVMWLFTASGEVWGWDTRPYLGKF